MSLASAPRESSGQNDRLLMAVQAAPAPPGAPAGVTVFANAIINYQHHNPASHHECKNTRHRDSAPTAHTAERYAACITTRA